METVCTRQQHPKAARDERFSAKLARHGNEHAVHARSHTVRFLSDTIVIGCHTGQLAGLTQEELDRDAVYALSILVSALIRDSLECEPFLLYRGCIAMGEFVLDGNFMVGEAVDELAESMDKADGAFVWLTPAAWRLFATVEDIENETAFVRYPVPLKDGRLFETGVVNPFRYVSNRHRLPLLEKMIASFNSSALDVQIKRQNTERFLRTAFQTTALMRWDHEWTHLHTHAPPLESTCDESES
jgi:hypothetical protein